MQFSMIFLICLLLLQLSEAYRFKDKKDTLGGLDEDLTPEKISAQLGIPIHTNVPHSLNFGASPTTFPNTQYSRVQLEEEDRDVFEEGIQSTSVSTRKNRGGLKIHKISTTRPNEFSVYGNSEESSATTSTEAPILVDNEVNVSKKKPRPNKEGLHKTTAMAFLVDNEALEEEETEEDNSRRTTYSTTRMTESYYITSTTQTAQETTFTTRITEVPNTTTATAVRESNIVDGEVSQSKLYTSLPAQTFTTGFGPFNPWILFTTFPPSSIPSLSTGQYNVDYAPNCLANAVLCRENGNYEKFMRTYCRETCRRYDDVIPPRSEENSCKDAADNCETLKHNCFVPSSPYYLLLKRDCKKTCQYCSPSQTTLNNYPAPDPSPITNSPLPFGHLLTSLSTFGSPTPQPRVDTKPFYGCRDIGQNCKQFLGACEQASMASIMTQYCAATCNFCASCEDVLGEQQCAEFVQKGFCGSPHFRTAIKKQYCRRSCNLCDPLPSPLLTFVPLFNYVG